MSSARLWRILVVFLVSSALHGSRDARADEGDVVNFFAGVRYAYDNNLLRLPDGVSFLGERSDSITSVFAGTTFDKTVSRQRFRGDLAYYSNRYANFTGLNYQAPTGKASWSWQAGNRWSGQAAVEYSESLTDFRDYGPLFRTRNIMTTRQASVSANYLVHPDWSMVGQLVSRGTKNDSEFRRSLDLDRNTCELGFQHARPSGNRLGVTIRRAKGTYPNRVVDPGVSTIDNRFEQDDLETRMLWLPAGHGRFDARAAFTRRTHPNVPQRDFAGPTGRLSYDWFVSVKSSVNVTAGRDISEYEQVGTSYVDRRNLRVAPTWNPSVKLSLQAGLEYQRLKFSGETGFVANASRREDKIQTAFVTATYAPVRYFQVMVNLQHDRRTSNEFGLDYEATYGHISAQGSF